MNASFYRHRQWLLLVLATFGPAVSALAQNGPRFYVRPLDPGVPHTILLQQIIGVKGEVVLDLDFPNLAGPQGAAGTPSGTNAVAALLTPQAAQQLQAQGNFVRRDVQLRPNDARGGGPPVDWALDSLVRPGSSLLEADCCGESPVIYVVDTGIEPGHAEFAHPGAQFLSGLGLALGNPYMDTWDHGTRLAGCLGGLTTGLLPHLGLRARIKSVLCYDPPGVGPPGTWASAAIYGIYEAVNDHALRAAGLRYLRNANSVLLFASTSDPLTQRIGDLDAAIRTAWDYGIVVAMAAGNDAAPAADVSPAGAGWGYAIPPTTEWWGPKPGGTFYIPAYPEYFLTAAAHTSTGAAWAMSNFNGPGVVMPVDFAAPGESVQCPAAGGGMAFGSGTSYSAAFTAGWSAWIKTYAPWASPVQVRTLLKSSLTATVPPRVNYVTARDLIPGLELKYAQWVARYRLSPPNADPSADQDRDGMVTIVEYFCGLDPRRPDRPLGPDIIAERDSGKLRAVLPIACYLPGVDAEVTCTLQHSPDLVEWEDITSEFRVIDPCQPAGDGTLHHAFAELSTLQRMYYRLRFFAPGL